MKIKNILQLSTLLLLGYCNISLALGIGEIAIKSHLGEALSAQINITDVEKAPDISCFSLTELNSPPAFTKTAIAIKHHANNYQLIISTHEAITEPILNLHLTHHCDPGINRDYVALLDPPLQNTVKTDAEKSEESLKPANAENQSATSTSIQSAVNSNTASTHQTAKEDISKKKKSAQTAKISSLNEKLTAIYTGTPQAPAKSLSNHDAEVGSKPYLMISGGEVTSGTIYSLPKPALRLETQIDLSRIEQAAPLTTTDVMDEITAIDNRLALLKNQIIILQDKNEKLKNDAENAKMQLEDAMSKLRIAAGLIALLAFIEWLRRRLIRLRLARTKYSWLDNDDLNSLNGDLTSSATISTDANTNSAKNTAINDSFYEKSDYGLSSDFGTSLSDTSATTTVNGHDDEDILESIDVLIEYGRYGLAIQLLHDYLANHPSESPKVWLKHLSLIAEHGSEADYTQTLDKCGRYYRIKVPSFAEARKAGSATLEDFPFITKELESVWGSASAVALLNDLIYNSESQPEEGFEPEIFEQLFLLKQIAENIDTVPANINTEINKSSINFNQNHPETAATQNSGKLLDSLTKHVDKPVQQDYKTSVDESVASIHGPETQNPALDETLPTFNFDDYFIQNNDVTEVPDNFASDATTFPSLDENNTLSEVKPTLDAPEIDFSQHINEVADTQNITAESTQKVNEKPLKRTAKDSNLIDWVITDET